MQRRPARARQSALLCCLALSALPLWACRPPAAACDAGLVACDTACADTARDPAHCGACGHACGVSQSCVAGACYDDDCAGTECTAAAICRGGRCTERTCLGVTCPAGERCAAGYCESASCADSQCPEGSVCRAQACVDVSCNSVVCPLGQACSQGACYPRSCAAFDCNLAYACIQDDCINLACQGVICAAGRFCLEGVCRPTTCGGNLCPDRSVCLDDACVATDCLGVICPAGLECQGGRCTCVPGTSCTPVNECATSGVCGANALCTDTASSFDCACAPGFTGPPTTGGVPAACTDVDECQTSGLCGASTTCTNTPPGSYTCACGPGFSGASVVGGPASCSNVDRCTTPGQCGANAICNTTATSYTCTCAPGFGGAQTTGAPATCTDTNECADAGACGPYTSCANLTGSYLCSCVAGSAGTPTDGGPASCAPIFNLIGTAVGSSVTVGQPVDAGTYVVLVAASSDNFNVFDNRGNAWIRVVQHSGCGSCGIAAIFQSNLTQALRQGDQISLQPPGSPSLLWVVTSPKYPHLDRIGTSPNNMTSTAFLAVTQGAVTAADELLIGGFSSGDDVVLTPDGGATAVQRVNTATGSGLIEWRTGTALSGAQALVGEASQSTRFSGVIATFYGGPRVAPTGLSLTHSPRHRDFTVNWTGGRGNGGPVGCSVRYLDSTGTSRSASNTVDCDLTTSRTVTLPISATWYGASWSSVTVQLVRNGDGALLGTFPQRLTCASTAAASSPTPDIDENCNGTWDDYTCGTWTWQSGTVYGTNFAACTNSLNPLPSLACSASVGGVKRYTTGQGTTQTPAQVWSSDSVGTACQGSYVGAVQWTCVGSACSYR